MTLGRRLVSFYEISSSGTSSINEQSISNRMLAYKLAWGRFAESPVFGKGIDSFVQYSKESPLSREGFCPDNYLELLQGVGIIGTFMYYMTYMHVIRKSIHAARKHIDVISVLAFCVFLAMLIEHISVVFYYQKLEYLYLGFFLAAVQVCCEKEKAISECEKTDNIPYMIGEAV